MGKPWTSYANDGLHVGGLSFAFDTLIRKVTSDLYGSF